jgi:uncharacterized protein
LHSLLKTPINQERKSPRGIYRPPQRAPGVSSPPPELASLEDIAITVGADPGKEFRAELRKNLLGGVVVLKHAGIRYEKSLTQQPLYQLLGKAGQRSSRPVSLTMIPYFAWANREPSAMQVWIAYVRP